MIQSIDIQSHSYYYIIDGRGRGRGRGENKFSIVDRYGGHRLLKREMRIEVGI